MGGADVTILSKSMYVWAEKVKPDTVKEIAQQTGVDYDDDDNEGSFHIMGTPQEMWEFLYLLSARYTELTIE